MKLHSAALLAVAVLCQACAADTSREHEAFDRSAAGTSIEVPPERPGEERPSRTAAPLRVTQGLTLEEAEQIALEVNSNMLAAGEAVNAAKANVWQQELFTNPVFGINKAEVPVSRSRLTADGTGVIPNLTNDTFVRPDGRPVRPNAFDLSAAATQFSLSKDFDVSGKRGARVDAAIEGERQSEAQFASASRQLKAQVRTAYAAVLVAERSLELAQEAYDMAKKNLDILGTGAIGGKVLEGDSAAAQSAAERARVDLKQAELTLANAKISFLSLLECPSARLGPLRGTLPLETLADDVDVKTVVKEALLHNADVIASKRAVLAAEANLRLQKRSVIPDVTLSATYNRYFLDRLDSFAFGVSVPLPIFDQNRAQIALAVANLHQAEAQESATEVNVEQSVRTDLQQIATSHARIEAFEKEILPKARDAWKLTEASFEGGKVLYLSVIAARQTYNQQRQDYATELLNYETAMADLERLLGHSIGVKVP